MKLPEDFDYGYGVEPYKSYRPRGLITYYNLFKKNGDWRKTPEILFCAWFTHLRKCHFCGKVSTPKNIQIRSFFGGEDVRQRRKEGCSWMQEPTCVGCWNKVRKLSEAHFQVRENRTLLRRVKETAREQAKLSRPTVQETEK